MSKYSHDLISQIILLSTSNNCRQPKTVWAHRASSLSCLISSLLSPPLSLFLSLVPTVIPSFFHYTYNLSFVFVLNCEPTHSLIYRIWSSPKRHTWCLEIYYHMLKVLAQFFSATDLSSLSSLFFSSYTYCYGNFSSFHCFTSLTWILFLSLFFFFLSHLLFVVCFPKL